MQTEENRKAIEESTEPVVESEETTEKVGESVESTETTENEEVAEEETLSQEGLQKVEFYFPNSHVEEIPEELLVGMSADSLRIARNEIYARHGYVFKDSVLWNYFDNCSWYEQTMEWSEEVDESELNSMERLNVEKIKDAEARVRLAAPVPVSDLITLNLWWNYDGGSFFYAYIKDGCFYYNRQYGEGYGMNIYSDSIHEHMQKLPGISNIKRMKTYNMGSGVDPVPFLITEDGEVYLVRNAYGEAKEELQIGRFEFLKDYQVEDILSYSGEWQHRVEVLLKDGSIIYLESEPWG